MASQERRRLLEGGGGEPAVLSRGHFQPPSCFPCVHEGRCLCPLDHQALAWTCPLCPGGLRSPPPPLPLGLHRGAGWGLDPPPEKVKASAEDRRPLCLLQPARGHPRFPPPQGPSLLDFSTPGNRSNAMGFCALRATLTGESQQKDQPWEQVGQPRSCAGCGHRAGGRSSFLGPVLPPRRPVGNRGRLSISHFPFRSPRRGKLALPVMALV